MTILLSSFGGGGLPRLAPDLSRVTDSAPGTTYQIVTGIDATGGLTEVLNANGRYVLGMAEFNSMTSGDTVTINLSIDGEPKFNSTGVNNSTGLQIYNGASSGNQMDSGVIINSNITLSIQTTTDNNIDFSFLLRPIQ